MWPQCPEDRQGVAAPQVPLTSLHHRFQTLSQKQNPRPLAYSSQAQLRLGSSQSQKQGAQSRSPITWAITLVCKTKDLHWQELEPGANLRHCSRACGPHVEIFYHSVNKRPGLRTDETTASTAFSHHKATQKASRAKSKSGIPGR